MIRDDATVGGTEWVFAWRMTDGN